MTGNGHVQTALPPLAPYPPESIQQQLSPSQWDGFQRAYITIGSQYLNANDSIFKEANRDGHSLHTFLKSYFEAQSTSAKHATTKDSASQLRRQAFLLVHRSLSGCSDGIELYGWAFLASVSQTYLKTRSLESLLQAVWQRRQIQIKESLAVIRSDLTTTLEHKHPAAAEDDLRKIAPLLHSLPNIAAFMAEGSEFLDALSNAYSRASNSLQDAILPVAFLSLSSLTKPECLNRSALIDHLYSLKSQAEQDRDYTSLLADLVTNTPLLSRLAGQPGEKGAERARIMAASLQAFKSPAVARRRPTKRPQIANGKQHALPTTAEEHHVHLLSRISQIQDLFPDLGSGFVARLLDAFDEDFETVTSHLLEDTLPPHLASLDRSLQLLTSGNESDPSTQAAIGTLVPRPTPSPLPDRRNVFDNDEFDRLSIDPSKIHRGYSQSTDKILSQPRTTQQKASILAALAAFDSDDDERDDTYDEADVGGTVDHAAPDGEESSDVLVGSALENEEALFRAWKSDARLFGRGNDVRRSEARKKLREDTNFTDEAIEGWAIMLSRDGRRIARLEARYGTFDGGQQVLESTRYRAEDDEGDHAHNKRGRGGRPRGRGGGRGAGNVVGQPVDAGTQRARQGKEASKSSRANHNRRNQRAKKMSRGGFAG